MHENNIPIINNFFQIKNDWNILPIKYLLKNKITDGPHETPNFIDKGIPFLSVDSIIDGKLVFEGCRYISKKDYEKYKNKCNPQKNDIFMGKAASIGKIAIVDVEFPFSIWSPLALIRPDTNKIIPKFLEYSLKSRYAQDQIEQYATSNTQKNISMEDIPKIKIILPKIIEQKRIVNYLDNKTALIEENIEKNKKLIELLKEKRTSLINQAVTKGLNPDTLMKESGVEWIGKIPEDWKINKIKNLFEFSKGLNITKKDLTEKGIPVISYGQIHAKFNDGVHIKDTLIRYTNKSNAKTSSKVSKGDFIFADTSEDIEGCGNSIYINKDMLLYGGYHDVLLKSHNKQDNMYLAYLFQSEEWRKQIRSKVNGVKVYSINQSILKECYVLLPPIEEQYKITQYLENQTNKINKTIEKIERNIELLEEYKESLIHHVVTGKVDVKGEVL